MRHPLRQCATCDQYRRQRTARQTAAPLSPAAPSPVPLLRPHWFVRTGPRLLPEDTQRLPRLPRQHNLLWRAGRPLLDHSSRFPGRRCKRGDPPATLMSSGRVARRAPNSARRAPSVIWAALAVLPLRARACCVGSEPLSERRVLRSPFYHPPPIPPADPARRFRQRPTDGCSCADCRRQCRSR